MDNKPPIDFDKLKEFQAKKEKSEEPIEILDEMNGYVLTERGWIKKEILADPYYSRRHLINISDFDEWE